GVAYVLAGLEIANAVATPHRPQLALERGDVGMHVESGDAINTPVDGNHLRLEARKARDVSTARYCKHVPGLVGLNGLNETRRVCGHFLRALDEKRVRCSGDPL